MIQNPIPVIDLFAGPGGLGEGFSRFTDRKGKKVFKSALSIEKDAWAHQTLELRSFFRQFADGQAPDAYYDYLRAEITRKTLFTKFPDEAERARSEAWHAELGSPEYPAAVVHDRIAKALQNAETWVLLGGPPCQAYSLVGRSRILGEDRKSKDQKNRVSYEDDHRHFLYKHYLRIIAHHRPPVFVMENVKGLLSSMVRGRSTLEQILKDLRAPRLAISEHRDSELAYQLFPLSPAAPRSNIAEAKPEDFVVEAEHFGIPQTRHRLLLVGVRSDLAKSHQPAALKNGKDPIPAINAIADLPRLRSALSKDDSREKWQQCLDSARWSSWFWEEGVTEAVRREILWTLKHRTASKTGGRFQSRRNKKLPKFESDWFHDSKLKGWVNHETRNHMASDLHRYLFAAAYAKVNGCSPKLSDFPKALLPAHQNVDLKDLKNTIFPDRFRVQVANQPATTVTSHSAKDGHYYIHPDPSQCRSLTVREAARLQTFPDNYFFEGPRTEQFKQVGNAVPPLLAHQIAAIIAELLQTAFK
jgi:DNA (cytosine-5)-methyltransferase 1